VVEQQGFMFFIRRERQNEKLGVVLTQTSCVLTQTILTHKLLFFSAQSRVGDLDRSPTVH